MNNKEQLIQLQTQIKNLITREYVRSSVILKNKRLWAQLLWWNDSTTVLMEPAHRASKSAIGKNIDLQRRVLDWKLNLPQRICKDLTEIAFGEQSDIEIYTDSPEINNLIQSELFERMDIRQTLPKFFYQVLAYGDGGISVYANEHAQGRPDWNFHNGLQLIFTEYDAHSVYSSCYFTFSHELNGSAVGDDTDMSRLMEFIDITYELPGQRVLIHQACKDSISSSLIQENAKLWPNVLAQLAMTEDNTRMIDFQEVYEIPKFFHVHTGLFDARYSGTPYHNSVFWNITLIEEIEYIYSLLKLELDQSVKAMFLNPDVFKSRQREANGQFKDSVKRFEHLFKQMDIGKEQIKEWTPEFRIQAYIMALNFAFRLWGQELGVGPNFYAVSENGELTTNTATGLVYSYRPLQNFVHTLRYSLIKALKGATISTIQEWLNMGMITEQNVAAMGDVAVRLPDTIIFSKQDDRAQYFNLADRGIMSKQSVLIKGFDYSQTEAIQEVQRAEDEQMIALMLQNGMLQPSGMSQQPNKSEDSTAVEKTEMLREKKPKKEK